MNFAQLYQFISNSTHLATFGGALRTGPVTSAFCHATLLLLVTAGAHAQVVIPPEYISVGDYSGSANERISAAIAAAMATDHKTVFFPNGTYALRSGLGLNQGLNTELHLVGESREGVLLVPDVPYLEANFNGGSGASLAHMINLDRTSVFDSVNISIQNMTLDMRHQRVMGEATSTYNVVGHGIRVGKGWREGQFTVNEVTIRNVQGYGIGIQDRHGHPKNNLTLTNLNIERTGSDGIDTKEASGDGNRNLVIRNVNINEVGFLDTGAAPAIDIRYRDTIIENVNLVSRSSQSTLPGQTSSTTGILFRGFEAGAAGIVGATVSDVYIRGFNNGIILQSNSNTTHQNINVTDFYIQGQQGTGVSVTGNNHSGHTISNGSVDPAFGGSPVSAGGQATVTNVVAGRLDPALTPTTNTTFESNVSLAGDTFSPAWTGIVGTERVSLNPTAPSAGPFVFDVGSTGLLQIDFDTVYNAMDKLIVDGTLNLDGQLLVNMIGGTPTTARTFQIFEADTISGAFDTISLPAAGPGLTWRTDSLSINGTIELLQGFSIRLGDTNTTYDPLSPDDNPPVDAAFAAAIGAISPSWQFLGLDQVGSNDVRAMTFTFDAPNQNELESVTIQARVFGLSGFTNDSMALDAANIQPRISNMTGYNPAGGWMTLVYELDPSQFALLGDGQLNLAFFDDTRVDWVELSWILANEPVILAGDYNNDGLVDAADYTVWRDNLGAPAGTLMNDTVGGVIGSAQYTLWRANFGTSRPAAALAGGSVPEPGTLALLALAVCIGMKIRPHRIC